MNYLRDLLEDDAQRAAIVQDCCQLIDIEVASKRGVGGAGLKIGYQIVRGIRPDFISKAVESLLPEFADVLNPLCEAAVQQGGALSGYFEEHCSQVAEALLEITDRKAQSTKHVVIKRTYAKMRGSARRHVKSAVPGLGLIIEKYVGS